MNAPKIATITAFPLGIPFDHWASPPMFAGRPRTSLDTVLVRVTTDQGTVGWGEAYGSFRSAVVAAIEQWVSPLAIGQSVYDVELPARIGVPAGLERRVERQAVMGDRDRADRLRRHVRFAGVKNGLPTSASPATSSSRLGQSACMARAAASRAAARLLA